MNEFRTQEVPCPEHEINPSVLQFDKEDSGEPVWGSDSRGSDTVGAVYALTKKTRFGRRRVGAPCCRNRFLYDG